MIETENQTRRFIRDTQGRQYELTSLLGRGSFGKVYRAECAATGKTLAAKLPLSEEDFSGEAVDKDLKALYSRLLRDEAAQLRKLPPNRIPRIHGIVDGGGAVPCLLTEYFSDSLLERLRKGMDFAQFCDALAMACRALEVIHATGQTHGNLKPGNIFFVTNDDGLNQVRFTDPLTPLYHKNLDTLSVRDPSVAGWIPPECLSEETQLPLPRNADAFAIGKLFFEAIVHPENLTASFSGKGGPFLGPIDKGTLNRFRSALSTRLQEGKSNPHVRDLLIKRATSFLARALSKDAEPSPPYRFCAIAEMANRLEELRGLFHPGFQHLGSLISGSQHADGGFYAGEEIRFSISFRCHGGIDDIDLITCMTYVRDLVAEQKVRDAGVQVYPSHDGHRFRFSFRIPALQPGHYLVRVALAIKGSPGKPVHRDLTFTVHEEEAEGTSEGWTETTAPGDNTPPSHAEDKLSVDVIPPDLLRHWRSEPEPRKTTGSQPSDAPPPTPAKTRRRDGTSGTSPKPHGPPPRRNDTKSRKGIMWTLDGEDTPSDKGAPPAPPDEALHPLDDKPARIVVRPDPPASGGPRPGSPDDHASVASTREKIGGHAGEARRGASRSRGTTDEDPDTHPRGSGRKTRPRAPLEAVAVGRDAVRHGAIEDVAALSKPRESAHHRAFEDAKKPKASQDSGRKGGHEDVTAPSKSRDTMRHAAREESKASARSQDAGHRNREDAKAQRTSRDRKHESGWRSPLERSSHHRSSPNDGEGSDRAAIPDGSTGGGGLSGGRRYYEKARSVPSTRDDPDAFFRKGAPETQLRVIIFATLSSIAVLIIVLALIMLF